MMRYRTIMTGLTALFLIAGTVAAYGAVEVYEDPVMRTDPVIIAGRGMSIEKAEAEIEQEIPEEEETEAQYEEEVQEVWQQAVTDNLNGEVVNVRTHLNIRSGAGKNYEVIGHLLPGDEVKVVGGDGDWYEIVAPETEGYVYGNYLELFQKPGDIEIPMVITDITEIQTAESSEGLTPVGNMTLVDDIGAISQAGQQFITLVTKNGNYFYLIIDRDDKGTENVHFLSLVDERDLLSLLSEEEAEEYEAEKALIEETRVQEPEPAVTETGEEAEIQEEKKKISALPLISIVIFVVIIGGFILIRKMRPTGKKKERPDPDIDYEYEEDDAYELPEGEYEEDEKEEETAFDAAVYPPDPDEESLAQSEEE